MILGELHVSVYPNQRKSFQLYKVILLQMSSVK